MKKIKLILIAVLVLLPALSFAQEKKNLIKTSLVFPFGDSFLFAYERMLGTETSLQLEVVVGEIAYSFRPEFRYYLSETKVAPSGVFIAPYLHLMEEDGGGGLLVGYQRLFKQKISLEAFAGPGIYSEGVAGWAGINFGFAF